MKKKISAVCSVALVISLILKDGDPPINKAGLELIGEAESCRTDPYICPAGYWTDGVGNTHNVIPGQQKSLMQIAADWKKNILVASSCVRHQFNGNAMNENELAAFTSLAFRTGCFGMRTYYDRKAKRRIETKLHRFAVKGDFKAACDEIKDFVNAGGIEQPGLKIRAKKERLLCLSPVVN